MPESSTSPGTFAGYPVRPDLAHLDARALPANLPERLLARIDEARRELAAPFVGVTTDGTPLTGLFGLRSTGVSTQPMVEAAHAFLAALDAAQRDEVMRAIDSSDWRAWLNPEMYLLRHGLLLERLDAGGREAALALVRASLSRAGGDRVRNLMRLNELLKDLTGNLEGLGEWLYFLTIFGTPSATEPWGWQLDGHHININCFVIGDQVVLTPTMLGAEPVYGDRAPYLDIREFVEEEQTALDLMAALSPAQRGEATLFPSIQSKDLPPERYDFANGRQQAHALRDNVRIPYEGTRAAAFTESQRAALMRVVQAHTAMLRPGDEVVRLDEVRAHLDDTYVAWMGGHETGDVFYYKVHSPVVLIEFDMHKGIFLSNDEPERFHIHVVIRTPNGNDYGKDLLRQHLAVRGH
ncbi:MAG: DUF3500 domain-containing protein [Chloroflexota bacterium]